MAIKKRIFLLDDEPDIVVIVASLLNANGYFVANSSNPKKGLAQIIENPPDLVLLDVRMPEMDGFDVCRELKSNPKTKDVPIIMLSIESQEADVVAGLEVGADDYIFKPFRDRELLARVKSVLRRKSAEPAPQRLEQGPLMIDFGTYVATLAGKPLQLAPKEFQLLAYFIQREGQAMTRAAISEAVWGHEHDTQMRTIDTHVKVLRAKLGNYGIWIKSLRGIGFRFEMTEESD